MGIISTAGGRSFPDWDDHDIAVAFQALAAGFGHHDPVRICASVNGLPYCIVRTEGIPNPHGTVRHSVSEYVNKQAHTNGIESFWAALKRGSHGTYHQMSEKHHGRYVNEFAGRHNDRNKNTTDQMTIMVQEKGGKRLRYKDLTA